MQVSSNRELRGRRSADRCALRVRAHHIGTMPASSIAIALPMRVSNFMRTHKRRIGAKPVDAPLDDFCEDRPYNEWQVPVAPPGPHFLDLISQQGTFKSAPSPTVTDLCAQKPVADPPPPPVKTRLYTCVNAYEMRSIDPAVGTFKCSLRL